MDYCLWFLFLNHLMSRCFLVFFPIYSQSWPFFLVLRYQNPNPWWTHQWTVWVRKKNCEENPHTNFWLTNCPLGEEITEIASSWCLRAWCYLIKWISWMLEHGILHYATGTMGKVPSHNIEWHTCVENRNISINFTKN